MTTIIEWYDATKARPAKSGEYLINTIGNIIHIVNYSSIHNLFNALDGNTRDEAEKWAIPAKRWAELPKFPDTSDVVNEVLNNG